jgi:uncharacterized membrane protein
MRQTGGVGLALGWYPLVNEVQMKRVLAFVMEAVLAGVLIAVPIYVAVVLLLKGMALVIGAVHPIARLLPDWVPGDTLLSLLLVLFVCFLIGVAVRARAGKAVRETIEKTLLERIPGYTLIRSLTHRMAGESNENAWKPALFQSDEGLLPAFIIEEFEDGRYTVFVPSIPTPLAGAVYVLDRSRVHPLDVPFTDALRTVSTWGSGAKNLVAAMEKGKDVPSRR